MTVTATVTNTGPVAGAEVVQVYVGIPAAGQPRKRLVGCHKVVVEPGEAKPHAVTFGSCSLSDNRREEFVTTSLGSEVE